MKEFLANWVIFQLIVIGLAYGLILTGIEAKTLKCNQKINSSKLIFTSAILPLAAFVPEPTIYINYCLNNK
jgi:hypothetical protein